MKSNHFAFAPIRAAVTPDWDVVPLGYALTKTEYGLSDATSADGNVPVIGMKEISDGIVHGANFAKIVGCPGALVMQMVRKGDLLLNRTNSPDLVGKVGIAASDMTAVFASYLVRMHVARETADPEFVNYWLNHRPAQIAIKRISTRAVSQANVNPSELKRHCPLPLPPLPEQRRIAGILRTWDEAIDAASRLIDAKRLRAQGIALRLFEAATRDHANMVRAKELFAPVSERNRSDLPLLAVLQEGGVVRRDEMDRRVVMPESGTDTYKVIRPGDFIISLRSFQGGLEYSEIEGLVSPAYTVLRAQEEIEPFYYKHFFKSRSFIGRLDKLIFGIRDGKQIAFRDFGDMLIPRPSRVEQKRAVATLNLVEEDLAASKAHLDALKRQKRGLMQKLLTGEWRVPA